ncbi:MAG: hypothetical protein KY455_11725, partial [Euryarchaeota archaeon]|nr:hypothetical protein [Euryarchaeota archaeon]
LEARTAPPATPGHAEATKPAASPPAAAILRRIASAHPRHEAPHPEAVTSRCGLQRATGPNTFAEDRDFAATKTTSEVVIALAMWRSPIPRDP